MQLHRNIIDARVCLKAQLNNQQISQTLLEKCVWRIDNNWLYFFTDKFNKCLFCVVTYLKFLNCDTKNKCKLLKKGHFKWLNDVNHITLNLTFHPNKSGTPNISRSFPQCFPNFHNFPHFPLLYQKKNASYLCCIYKPIKTWKSISYRNKIEFIIMIVIIFAAAKAEIMLM